RRPRRTAAGRRATTACRTRAARSRRTAPPRRRRRRASRLRARRSSPRDIVAPMHTHLHRRIACAVASAALSLSACGDGKTTAGGGPSPAAPGQPGVPGQVGGATGGGAASPEVALAAAPRVDLLANRYRFHLHRDGLVIPFASEGLRKYTQEYAQPWGEVVELYGAPGRVLERSGSALRVPWRAEGEATARLWVHGLAAGQRVELVINGKRAGVAPAPASWTELVLPVAAGLLREGENELRVHVAKAGRAGGARSHALFHSLELVPGAAEASGQRPPLTPVAHVDHGGARDALTGPRLVLYQEIPPSAWLVASVGGAAGARFRVTARPAGGAEATTLLEAEASPGAWRQVRASLAPLSDQLVELELLVEGGEGAWAEPAIALEEARVAEAPPTYRNVVLVVVDALRSD